MQKRKKFRLRRARMWYELYKPYTNSWFSSKSAPKAPIFFEILTKIQITRYIYYRNARFGVKIEMSRYIYLYMKTVLLKPGEVSHFWIFVYIAHIYTAPISFKLCFLASWGITKHVRNLFHSKIPLQLGDRGRGSWKTFDFPWFWMIFKPNSLCNLHRESEENPTFSTSNTPISEMKWNFWVT